jgi:hypothetical protein
MVRSSVRICYNGKRIIAKQIIVRPESMVLTGAGDGWSVDEGGPLWRRRQGGPPKGPRSGIVGWGFLDRRDDRIGCARHP